MGRKIVPRVKNNNIDSFFWLRRRDILETSKLITFYQWNFAGVIWLMHELSSYITQHTSNISLVGSSHDFVKPTLYLHHRHTIRILQPVETSSYSWR